MSISARKNAAGRAESQEFFGLDGQSHRTFVFKSSVREEKYWDIPTHYTRIPVTRPRAPPDDDEEMVCPVMFSPVIL